MSYINRNHARQTGTNRTTQAEISTTFWLGFPRRVKSRNFLHVVDGFSGAGQNRETPVISGREKRGRSVLPGKVDRFGVLRELISTQDAAHLRSHISSACRRRDRALSRLSEGRICRQREGRQTTGASLSRKEVFHQSSAWASSRSCLPGGCLSHYLIQENRISHRMTGRPVCPIYCSVELLRRGEHLSWL